MILNYLKSSGLQSKEIQMIQKETRCCGRLHRLTCVRVRTARRPHTAAAAVIGLSALELAERMAQRAARGSWWFVIVIPLKQVRPLHSGN